MPIEIRELIIRASIEETESNTDSNSSSQRRQTSFADKEALVAACVEQVMQILEDKKER